MDVQGLRNLYDDVQIQVRSLQSLGIEEENYRSFLAPIIMERLPHEVELNINRNLDDELWNFTNSPRAHDGTFYPIWHRRFDKKFRCYITI